MPHRKHACAAWCLHSPFYFFIISSNTPANVHFQFHSLLPLHLSQSHKFFIYFIISQYFVVYLCCLGTPAMLSLLYIIWRSGACITSSAIINIFHIIIIVWQCQYGSGNEFLEMQSHRTGREDNTDR